MKESQTVLRSGNRDSSLAVKQAAGAMDRLKELFPSIIWEQINMSSPGDRDRKMDLKTSPADFFSRDLDEALIRGELDCAIHSAKDLEYPLREELDWVWLPWQAAREDVLVCREGVNPDDLDRHSIIGVSSERREEYCRLYFPELKRASIRGNIEDRIAQLDRGDFDMIIMAQAALDRLGLESRISRVIPLHELPTPQAQGVLALSFRKGDERFMQMRSLFLRSLRFVGSGPGDSSLCTLRGIQALQNCDICFYDSLLDPALLDHVKGETIYTGKRSGKHSHSQEEITSLLTVYARRGLRVVRLKGGDPGVFGRLAEETAALESLKIPFEVIPGISSLNAAGTGTGMLLTRREVSRGFTALSSRVSMGGMADTGPEARSRLPLLFFMSLRSSERVIQSLITEGRSPQEAAAVVYDAGSAAQKVIRGTLSDIPEKIKKEGYSRPGLLIAGEISRYSFDESLGALGGRKILLTCSERLMDRAVEMTRSLGGKALPSSLISLKRVLHTIEPALYDWIVLTSPAAIEFFMEIVREQKIDLRSLPRIIVCGSPSARRLQDYGLYPDICPPASFSADELIRITSPQLKEGDRVLRLRSRSAGSKISDALTKAGALVTDRILYSNEPAPVEEDCPDFDAVFFASSSAVDAYMAHWGAESLKNKLVTLIGKPSARTLESYGTFDSITAKEADIPSSLMTLAEEITNRKLKELL